MAISAFTVAVCVVTAAGAPKSSSYDGEVEVRGVLAFRLYRPHLTPERAAWLAKEARQARLAVPDASWVPIHVLLAIGLEETDLQWWRVRDGNQCGVSQYYVGELRLPYHKR